MIVKFYLLFHPELTCSEVDHGRCSSGDSIHLRVDFMFGFIHFVLDPNSGCLRVQKEKKELLAFITVGDFHFI